MKSKSIAACILLPAALIAGEPAPIEIPTAETDQQLLEIDLLSGARFDLNFYTIDGTPPGLLAPDPGDDLLIAPRFTLPVDVFWSDWLYGFGKLRFDTGFHPGLAEHELRADEYFVRFGPPDAAFQIQAGKFATVFGGWVQRHEGDDDAFVQAPLAYNELTSVIDQRAFPGVAAIAGNRLKPNNVRSWIPVIWDAAYIPGFSVFGKAGGLDYAAELKSHSNSSRPAVWDGWDFANPTWTGRVGHRPNAAWNYGASLSHGAYLQGDSGVDIGDFDQTTAGLDLSYAHHHWQIWAEILYSQFELPNIADDAQIWSYFIETRYKITPQLFAALRWNQQLYNELSVPAAAGGGSTNWDNDVYRIDAAFGYRFDPNTQLKLQYSWTHQNADFQNGENMVGLQLTTRLR